MKTSTVTVPLRDGNMSSYLAIPEGEPKGAIIAIMEIWGVNATMRTHAKEFADATPNIKALPLRVKKKKRK